MGGFPSVRRPRPSRPVTPGSDLAGIVIGVGHGVRSIRVGEAVFGVQVPFRATGLGRKSARSTSAGSRCKPENLSFGAAAACGVSGLVAILRDPCPQAARRIAHCDRRSDRRHRRYGGATCGSRRRRSDRRLRFGARRARLPAGLLARARLQRRTVGPHAPGHGGSPH